MFLEQQVCSLELAKRLKELGVEQSSLYYWVSQKSDDDCILSTETQFIYGDAPDFSMAPYPVVYSAFTVAELGELLLPNHYSVKQNVAHERKWYSTNDDGYISSNQKTEADCRALLLILFGWQRPQ
jgi:hypothetical protein